MLCKEETYNSSSRMVFGQVATFSLSLPPPPFLGMCIVGMQVKKGGEVEKSFDHLQNKIFSGKTVRFIDWLIQ